MLEEHLGSEQRRAHFLSADGGKTIDRVLTTDILQTAIKLTSCFRFWHRSLDIDLFESLFDITASHDICVRPDITTVASWDCLNVSGISYLLLAYY